MGKKLLIECYLVISTQLNGELKQLFRFEHKSTTAEAKQSKHLTMSDDRYLHLPFRLLCAESNAVNGTSISLNSLGKNALANERDKLIKTTKYDPHLYVLFNIFQPFRSFMFLFTLFGVVVVHISTSHSSIESNNALIADVSSIDLIHTFTHSFIRWCYPNQTHTCTC